MRAINDLGLALIKQFESCSLTSYRDVAGIWTIGWGHCSASPEETITEAEADSLLQSDLLHTEAAVNALTADVATDDNQFAAMVSLAFNIGIAGFHGSTVLRLHRGGDYEGAGQAFLMWDKAHEDGHLVTVPGLLNRRQAERALYAMESVTGEDQ